MTPWLLSLLLGAAVPTMPDKGPGPDVRVDFGGTMDRPPVTQWVRPLPGTPPAAATNSELGRPLISGDSIYVGTAGADALYELRRGDGSVLRSFPAGAPVMAEPLLVDGALLFADGAGYTWCYGLDGQQLWRHYAGAPVLASPLVLGDTVYVSALDGTLHALGLDDGQSRWLYKHPGDRSREAELELYGAPAPVAAGALVLAGFHDGSLVALDQANGEVGWKLVVGEGRYPDLIAEPLVSENMAYAGGFSAPFQAVGLDTHKVVWSLDFGIAASPVVEDRTLFVPGADGKLRAVDAVNGSVIWEWDSETSGAITEPQITPAGIFVASSDGGLWLVDPANGETRWTYDDGFLLNGASVAPTVSERQLLLITNAGNILSLVNPAAPGAVDALSEPPWTAPFAGER
jgi:outer membrane protein assembly factor BamB